MGGGWPRWSPDGTKIAFDAEFGGNDEIYMINQDGTGLQQLTFDWQPIATPPGHQTAQESSLAAIEADRVNRTSS